MKQLHELLKNVYLVIPWRPTEQRQDAFQRTIDNYKKIFNDNQIIKSDSNSEIFNLSASRNLGVQQAFSYGADLVVVSDADIIISINSLIRSVRYAKNNKEIYLPYNKYIICDKNGNEIINLSVPKSEKVVNPCSGCLIIPKKIYQELKGFDENFVGWGPEDVDFHYRYIEKYGKMFNSISGVALSIETEKSEWKINDQVIKNYEYFWSKYPQYKELYYWE